MAKPKKRKEHSKPSNARQVSEANGPYGSGARAKDGSRTASNERKQAEERLQQALAEAEAARDRIHAVVHSVASGLLVTDVQNQIVLMNAAAEELLGLRFLRVRGRTIDEVLSQGPLKENIAAAIDPHASGAKFDISFDGKTVQAQTSTIRDKSGHNSGVITVIQDVTKEREVDRMKSEFLSTAAHELRTPLTSIRGYTELLATRQFSPEKLKEMALIINTQAERLTAILNDLLDLSRIEGGRKLQLQCSECDIAALAREVAANFQNSSDRHTYTVEQFGTHAHARCDPDRVRQVFYNLLSNATKYSPKGGRIQIFIAGRNDEIECSVTDKGIGIAKADLPRMCERFFRADSSNTAVEGTGVGLSIVKAVISAHGGELKIQSKLRQGTTVSFTLPRRPP
ncbi:MAG TPA: ATP-binding protein [Planctomycetota bacterium]|nr:ATP-binding protein [Planctomycetota bacterium]